ncbi:MAG: bifunctional UDP-N-acetylglucosamine diphosphorylase/glucosamine-1-phosphate N-acetyltransferase GlmU [Dehalococcoidia bacterium]
MGLTWAGVVLAAGKGVRMRSRLPKTLHQVCGIPMLQHVSMAMRAAGVERLVAVASPALAESPPFISAAGDDALIAVQEDQRGTADAVLSARVAAGDAASIVVGAGDMPLIRVQTIQRMMSEHLESNAAMTVLTARDVPLKGMGRVRRNGSGEPVAIIEEAEADEETRQIDEVNTSWYCFDATWLWNALPKVRASRSGELYLTDLLALASSQGRSAAVRVESPEEALGINDRVQLSRAEQAMQDRIRRHWMCEGVTIRDPATTYIDAGVSIGQDSVILPGTHLRGSTTVGEDCEIGPGSVLADCRVGDGARVISSYIEGAIVGAGVSVGPFSRLRAGTEVAEGAYIGNFAEIKNSRVGPGVHVGHFSYVGDADLGRNVNIGAGTVTCNFDGRDKHRTVIGEGALIGSDTMLVAPVEVGRDARTGAGSVVNRDVPAGETVAGVPARSIRKRIAGEGEKDQ